MLRNGHDGPMASSQRPSANNSGLSALGQQSSDLSNGLVSGVGNSGDQPFALRAVKLAFEANQKAMHDNDYYGAIKLYEEAIHYNNEDSRFYLNRSFCYAQLELFQLALDDAQQAINLSPDVAKCYFRKGQALVGLKKYWDAEKAFKDVLRLEPGCTETTQELFKVRFNGLVGMGFDGESAAVAAQTHDSLIAAVENIVAATKEKNAKLQASNDISIDLLRSSTSTVKNSNLWGPSSNTNSLNWLSESNIRPSPLSTSVNAAFAKFGLSDSTAAEAEGILSNNKLSGNRNKQENHQLLQDNVQIDCALSSALFKNSETHSDANNRKNEISNNGSASIPDKCLLTTSVSEVSGSLGHQQQQKNFAKRRSEQDLMDQIRIDSFGNNLNSASSKGGANGKVVGGGFSKSGGGFLASGASSVVTNNLFDSQQSQGNHHLQNGSALSEANNVVRGDDGPAEDLCLNGDSAFDAFGFYIRDTNLTPPLNNAVQLGPIGSGLAQSTSTTANNGFIEPSVSPGASLASCDSDNLLNVRDANGRDCISNNMMNFSSCLIPVKERCSEGGPSGSFSYSDMVKKAAAKYSVSSDLNSNDHMDKSVNWHNNQNGGAERSNSGDNVMDSKATKAVALALRRPTNLWGYFGLRVANVASNGSKTMLQSVFSKYGKIRLIERINNKSVENQIWVYYDNATSPIEAATRLQGMVVDGITVAGQTLRLFFAPTDDQKELKFSRPKQPVDNKGECYYWRTTNCFSREQCALAHLPANKNIDAQVWMKMNPERPKENYPLPSKQ